MVDIVFKIIIIHYYYIYTYNIIISQYKNIYYNTIILFLQYLCFFSDTKEKCLEELIEKKKDYITEKFISQKKFLNIYTIQKQEQQLKHSVKPLEFKI